jgi:hypothetical protein
MSRTYRVLMTVLLIAYLSVGWASRNRKTSLGKQIYRPLRGMQTTLCLWQNWGMFAPAPTSSSWLSFTGLGKDGYEYALEPLEPVPERPFFNWRYRRRNKLAMSALNKKRKGLHRGLTQYFCAQQRELGLHLKSVAITRYKRHALRPKQARMSKPPRQRDQVIEMGSFRCR